MVLEIMFISCSCPPTKGVALRDKNKQICVQRNIPWYHKLTKIYANIITFLGIITIIYVDIITFVDVITIIYVDIITFVDIITIIYVEIITFVDIITIIYGYIITYDNIKGVAQRGSSDRK